MNILRKARSAWALYQQGGIPAILQVLELQYGLSIPQSARARWKAGVDSEIQFWDDYIRTKGGAWGDSYILRLDPELTLQPRPAALLPNTGATVSILDVGAGPLSFLGKKWNGKPVCITAVDPLANEYDRILDKYQIQPLVRTRCVAAEVLTQQFPPNSFDLVFARNCIDHSCNPERAICKMIEVVKPGHYVLLEHVPNEAENERYRGLHQWNFSTSENGDFMIGSRIRQLNMTRKYASICTITCEVLNEGPIGQWLVTRILKK